MGWIHLLALTFLSPEGVRKPLCPFGNNSNDLSHEKSLYIALCISVSYSTGPCIYGPHLSRPRYMSLGPCADRMGLSAMSTYGISVGQLPAMFIVVLRYPHVRADFFSSSVKVVVDPSTNGTAIDLSNPTVLHYMHSVNLPFAFMLCSALYAAFSLLTMQMIDKGVGQMCEIGYSDYTSTNTELATNNTIMLWNSIFLWMVVVVHSLLAAVLASPTSIHFVLLITLLNYVSLGFILQPR